MKSSSRIAGMILGLCLTGSAMLHAETLQSFSLNATMSEDGYYTESTFVGGGGAVGFSDAADADSFFTFANATFSTATGSSITGTRAGSAIKVFTNNEDFNWGEIFFDADLLDGNGDGTALPIIAPDLDVSGSIDQNLSGITTTGLGLVFFDSQCPITFSSVSGTVNVDNHEVVSVNLTATATFQLVVNVSGHPYIAASYYGTFTITGDDVQFSINDTYSSGGLGSSTVVWDLPGTLDFD